MDPTLASGPAYPVARPPPGRLAARVSIDVRPSQDSEKYLATDQLVWFVEVDMIGEELIRGMQSLLARFGIFARVGFKTDPRTNRKGCWTLRIQSAGDRRIFADEIGFIDPIKADKLEASFDKPGLAAKDVKRI